MTTVSAGTDKTSDPAARYNKGIEIIFSTRLGAAHKHIAQGPAYWWESPPDALGDLYLTAAHRGPSGDGSLTVWRGDMPVMLSLIRPGVYGDFLLADECFPAGR